SDASLDLSPPASSRSWSVSDLLKLLEEEEGGKEENSLEDSWNISSNHSGHSNPLPSGVSELENDSSHHDSKENSDDADSELGNYVTTNVSEDIRAY
ncbi:MAG: hypothetical protein K2W99_01485, partial [Chthoniobacterales bacterium]|nr:hypothetical protein [Chthoniobacterales bacterium]